MKKSLLLILFTGILLSLTTCTKEKSYEVEMIWKCNDLQHLDSAAVVAKLTGSWNWLNQSCAMDDNLVKADKPVKVVFKSDGTYTLTENSVIAAQGTWSLIVIDTNTWGLDLSQDSPYLYGGILFCQDLVMFNASILDGCDNVFERIN